MMEAIVRGTVAGMGSDGHVVGRLRARSCNRWLSVRGLKWERRLRRRRRRAAGWTRGLLRELAVDIWNFVC